MQLLLTTEEPPEQNDLQSVWRVHLAQMSDTGAPRVVTCDCVRAGIPSGALQTEWVTAESYFPVDAALPLSVRVQREPDDPADTFTRPMGLVLVKITPLTPPDEAFLVTDTVVDGAGYNSWPMIQNIGDTLVCAYSRGRAHNIDEDAREVFAKSSRDLGRSWSDEAIVAATPGSGEVAIGKGLDSTGAMLLWVRRIDSAAHGPYRHDLYRSEDGVTFTRLATPELDPAPIQITDCFALPGHGLMALWFAGPYGDDGPTHSWGTLTSADDGKSWTQTTIESNLTKEQWPTGDAVRPGDRPGDLLLLPPRPRNPPLPPDQGGRYLRSAAHLARQPRRGAGERIDLGHRERQRGPGRRERLLGLLLRQRPEHRRLRQRGHPRRVITSKAHRSP